MEYLIAVFKSRTQVIKFHEKLCYFGIRSEVVNTPREASLSCGLSVKFAMEDFGYANNILKAGGYASFAGFFRVKESGHHKIVRPY
ncbi:MAG: DUF3343 domain-containing protein [Clostridiales bacterium]|jgi:hypothetical protein|nr:DUF3343 domain-containing protein [Clostridiales bacterium]